MKNPAKALLFLFVLFTISCNTATEDSDAISDGPNQTTSIQQPVSMTGDYVDDSYSKRDEGYDFVTVSLFEAGGKPMVSVRSRNDRKKPTCTFYALCEKADDSTWKTNFEGKDILFTLTGDTLSVSTPPGVDNTILYYFCSGGGTLEGKYSKLKEPLDEHMLSPYKYNRTLHYGDYFFDVKATIDGSQNKLVIEPFGLKSGKTKIEQPIDGTVTNAEVGDLNIDGYPEILVYYTSAGSGSYGGIVGFSVNNGKSMSMISMPDIANNPEAKKGYMGHDEFAIVENTLVRRFPVYKEGDTNANPTGGMRQIQYKLKEGEALRQLVIDKIVEY